MHYPGHLLLGEGSSCLLSSGFRAACWAELRAIDGLLGALHMAYALTFHHHSCPLRQNHPQLTPEAIGPQAGKGFCEVPWLGSHYTRFQTPGLSDSKVDAFSTASHHLSGQGLFDFPAKVHLLI